MKQSLWDKEFAEGRWKYIEHTRDDCVYGFIEKWCNGGTILDLGCGAGNTGAELDSSKYSQYVGVDVSDVALQKARQRIAADNRSDKNSYTLGAIETYIPGKKYDVILFRESLFYIARWRLKPILDWYAEWLTPNGVIIVRLWSSDTHADMIYLIESGFEVLEKHLEPNNSIVITFRKRRTLPAVVGYASNYWWVAVLAILAQPEEAWRSEARLHATIVSTSGLRRTGRSRRC
jgi:2-polyprenyl-6-hydroxyphenyl methylase/3-demethylubiquinone-9 3-methyltransferase